MTHPLNNYRVINKDELENLKRQLTRAITYCNNAGSVDYSDPDQEPTSTWPGASGYARATMACVLEAFDRAYDCADLFE